TKKNWTTVRAIREIAQACQTSFKRFKFAGNKDRAAITKQAVSAFKIPPEVLQNVKLKDIQIKIIGFGETPLSLGTLEGNRFEIVLRDLTKLNIKHITLNAKRVTKSGFPNYFGEQRFGGGNTALIGREIVRGYFKDAVKYLLTYSGDKNTESVKARKFAEENFGDWNKIIQSWPKFLGLEAAVLNYLVRVPTDFAGALRNIPKPIRRIYVHGYQSYLWNKGVEAVLKSKTKLKKTYPIPGFKTKLGNDKFSQEIKKLLFADGLTLDSFRCSRMPELASEGVDRQATVKPKKLKIGKPETDELNTNKLKVKLTFELPKGVYATELIRSLDG
ncbi:MAG: tRNA pseudouridine(13) synthase TruD, partial [Nanoarchaeota archaeon]